MMQRNEGFTLVEVTMVVSLVLFISAMTSGVLVQSMQTWQLQENYAAVSASLRSGESLMSQELYAAALEGVGSSTPPVEGLVIADQGTSVTFQRPFDVKGTEWSSPITYRLRNEDSDDNLLLGASEDLNVNGHLDRVIERLEDLNADGDFDDSGEIRVLVNDIDDLLFTLDGSTLTVLMVSKRAAKAGGQMAVKDTLAFSVLLVN